MTGFVLAIVAMAVSFAHAQNQDMPRVLVNHDFYIGAKTYARGVAQLPLLCDSTAKSVAGNQRELASYGAGFALNSTYGQHQLGYWRAPEGTAFTYREWIDELLGSRSAKYLASGAVDVLAGSKLAGLPEATVLNRAVAAMDTAGMNLISVRLNDHHHVKQAVDFVNPSADISNADIASSYFARRLAALSPQYLAFLAAGKTVSAATSDNPGCRPDSEQLDFADANVISQKQRELRDLVKRLPLNKGIELDLLRNNCFFRREASLALREHRMHVNLIEPLLKEIEVQRPGQDFKLVVRLPLGEDLQEIGINLQRLAVDLYLGR